MKKRKKETLKDQQQLRGVLFWSRANRSQRVDTQQQLRQVPQQHCSHHPCRAHFQNSFFFLFSPQLFQYSSQAYVFHTITYEVTTQIGCPPTQHPTRSFSSKND